MATERDELRITNVNKKLKADLMEMATYYGSDLAPFLKIKLRMMADDFLATQESQRKKK